MRTAESIKDILRYKILSLELIKKMNEKIDSLETSKKLIQLQSSLIQNYKPDKSLATLLNIKQWRYFNKDQLMLVSVSELYKIEQFIYAEILLDWIGSNRPTQDIVTELWHTLDQTELSYGYVVWVEICILTYNYTVPPVEQLANNQYKYRDYYWDIDSDTTLNLTNKTPIQLIKPKECFIRNCKQQTEMAVTMQLCDSVPCYNLEAGTVSNEVSNVHYHPGSIVHWYLLIEQNEQWIRKSLVTQSSDDIVSFLSRKEEYSNIRVVCLSKYELGRCDKIPW